MWKSYTKLDKQYCPGNMMIMPGSLADKHRCYKKRCYLNSETECNVHVQEDTTVPDKEYMLLVKPLDDNERRLAAKGRALQASHVRKLLAAEDPGISWENILRFKDPGISWE